MANELYNEYANQCTQSAPDGGFTDFVRQWQQFRAQYQGDPHQQIQQMLQSGQLTQEQLNRAQQLAQQFIRLIPRQ